MFNTVIPCFKARPLRGLTWASNPCSSSILIPVGTKVLSKGFKPNLYYITIEVYCKYPANQTATTGDTIEWQSIGTIRLGFKQ